jgi:hypothetical protein
MRLKYEVCNGVSNMFPVDFHTRKMSYLSMIGNTKETQDIVSQEQYPIELKTYYNS